MTANDSVSLEPPPQGLLRGPELHTVGSGQQHSTRAPRPLSVMDGAAGGAGGCCCGGYWANEAAGECLGCAEFAQIDPPNTHTHTPFRCDCNTKNVKEKEKGRRREARCFHSPADHVN